MRERHVLAITFSAQTFVAAAFCISISTGQEQQQPQQHQQRIILQKADDKIKSIKLFPLPHLVCNF